MKPEPLAGALFLTVAFIAAGIVHSLWLRTALSRRLLIPLDGGLTVRGRRLFGDNKTLRGFVVMVPAAAAAFAALDVVMTRTAPGVTLGLWPLSLAGYAALGGWAGLGFMLGELPNSFVKRQLDIEPGLAPRNSAGAAVSFIVDRIDSILGMLVAVSLAAPTPAMMWVYVLIIGPGIHLAFSVFLYRLGVKARAA